MEIVDSTSSKTQNYKLDFLGNGGEFFGILIINWFLTIVTLGFYYPWAKAKRLQYLYNATTLNDDSFEFHGTGKEMFNGFIKAIAILGVLYAILIGFTLGLEMPIVGAVVFYLAFLAIVPIAIHGSYKYRMSRSSWRGIRFGYRGVRNELFQNFLKWIGLSIITFGIYGFWFTINLRKYLIGNIKFGDINFKYDGDGGDYFVLNLKGYFLSILTLGIYFFWWQKDLIDYYINNISLEKEGDTIELESSVTGGGLFKLTIVNLLMIIFTLGLGAAWVEVRTIHYLTSNIHLKGSINLDSISQTEENFKDATGDDIQDMLDIDFV